MSNRSRKHHYIPQFYLNGFCRSDNTFSVYDKEYDHFRDPPQSPASNFFEKCRNTIKINGVRTNVIEKSYSKFETQFSQLFDLIQSGVNSNVIITEEGIHLLKTFIAIQFWRLPLVDNFARNYINNFDLEEVGDAITLDGIPIGEIDKMKHLLKTDRNFQYYFRCFYLPILTFDRFSNNDNLDHWYIFNLEGESKFGNQICGDSPIIIEDINGFQNFTSTLIFPLTKSRLLIYSPTNTNLTKLEPSFSAMVSLVILAQSQKYICGPDKNYLSKIIDTYKENQGKIINTMIYEDVINCVK